MLPTQYHNKIKQVFLLCITGLCLPVTAMAQEAAAAANTTPSIGKYQLMRYILTGVALLFLFIILVMANAVGSAGKIYWEREKKKKAGESAKPLVPVLLLAMFTGFGARAQEATVAAARTASTIPKDIYLFFVIVALEFAIIMVLSSLLLKFLRVNTAITKPSTSFSFKQFFQKVNQTVAVEDEAQLDLQHDYDGIRELDNKVPKWWQYAFYASILFGVVYIYRMFVAGSLPDQIQELHAANQVAAVQKAEYLKNAANNVDENTVTMMDASGIAEGAGLFAKNCLACHGDKGQGSVGPNLTDDYWLHNGGIRDIFHSIKYGWPEKGMKSWEADFSPVQIAQLASYIKSLKGSNPPGAKEPQGTVYTETATYPATDTSKTQL